MTNYFIKKTSNGEHKEISKNFKLNTNRYFSDTSTLYFDVEGQEIPFLMNYGLFFDIITEQIQSGLLEKLDYNNGIISFTIRDGNIIKNYNYDFNFKAFDECHLNSNVREDLQRTLYKVVSLYKENPNSSISSEQKYMMLIYDIIDGDRIPTIEDPDELLRVFEVYNLHKIDFLESLLNNVIFYDDNGNILEYREKLREKKLNLIRYDVYNQMEAAILIFAQQCNAVELYQNYLENLYIPRREIVYKEYDDNGNEIEVTPEIEGGTIFSLSRELIEQGLSSIKELAEKSKNKILKKKTNTN